ncbi:DNA-binding transcriptional regulator, PadR family [Mycolicibacterium rutilum]|uniref:DNA-binding transcriptional regulator, PadR family n=1 Tax=Mycolicibacterium rutilum TaxID=370526 RepID=A0A1H6JDP6_MYCRU|nr:PadR family transcriptional regulator [Mycolicibacterium rutilum]SEH59976.1 DNA-binding transcriptional regulator, PadR family [Mycolicibacterium rutilum]
MTNPFTPPPGGFGPGGFTPFDRRAMHQQRRHARRELRHTMREQFRQQAPGAGFGPGFGSGFGPGRGFEFGFDPRMFGTGGPRGHRRGGRGRGRRGDVRAALLRLLAERPMHGYEMIQEIAERSQNLWRPSPGSIYPTLQLLVDEGLAVSSEAEGSKKLFELTEDGRAAAEKIETPPWEEITDNLKDEAPGHANLRSAVGQLMGAVAQSTFAATEEQQQRIVDIVNNARREIYGILGESE